MRADQRHNEQGQFTQRRGYDLPEGERLEYPIGCKVSANELRRYAILFDQCRKQFGWQTMSDMYRGILDEGYRVKMVKVKNPTPEMLSMASQAEELERIEAGAMKHKRLDATFERVNQSVETALHAGDLPEVRKQLMEFRDKTVKEKDPMIRQRRNVEWDMRYARLWEGLNRGISLDPKTFVTGDGDED